MTVYQQPPPKPRRGNHLALWAGLTAFFANLAAINVIALLGDESDPKVTAIAAFITACTTAGAVFARQKMDDEKQARGVDSSPGA